MPTGTENLSGSDARWAEAGLDRDAVRSSHAGGQAPRRSVVLKPAGADWLNLRGHLHELWAYRDLLRTLCVHRINVRYRQTVLGFAWAVLQPLAMMLVFALVFSRLARIPSEGAPYALFAFTALLPWICFSSSVTTATSSLVSHTQLITKVYFPREILPLTYVIAALFDLLIGLVVLAALMLWFSVPLTSAVVFLVPVIAVLAGWSFAVSLALSAAQVRWRDIGVALPIVVQLGMFVSPVVYPLDVVPAAWRPIYLMNPMAGIIQSFRDILLRGQAPDPLPLMLAAVVTLAALAGGYLVFKRTEATMADVI